MIEHILYLSIGAILVTFGVLAGALADRIRNRHRIASHRPRIVDSSRAPRLDDDTPHVMARALANKAADLRVAGATDRLRGDVVRTLKASGYSKTEAEQAADACHGSERSTIEAWTRAALRRLAVNLEARS